MIRKLFRKKSSRLERMDAQISVKYDLSHERDCDINFAEVKQRAIADDISKKGMKLTVTPIFDKELIRQVKKQDTFFFVEFSLPPDNIALSTVSKLCWVKNDMKHFPAVTEIGLEFVDLSAEDKVIINRYIVRKKKERT